MPERQKYYIYLWTGFGIVRVRNRNRAPHKMEGNGFDMGKITTKTFLN